jgi:hypothetical protein
MNQSDGTGKAVRARVAAVACVWVLPVILSGAVLPVVAAAQDTGMSGGPPPAAAASPAAPEGDPATRSARSIECAQKADAQGLQGKIRKHFLHQCKSSV